MAILSKGTTYADGDQITSTNLNALVDSATFAAGAVESGGGLQLNGSSPAQLKVAGNVDIGTSNLTATGAISLGATTFNDNNITHVGSIALDTIIADNTDVTIDAAGDIILDAGGADILLKDDGTQFGSITNLSGDLIIQSSVQDKDIFIKGDDNGSVITALKLDMSSAGDATFNNKVIATELDIGGDIDVAGTANLDIVDIDGAVDMASTLQVDGVATFTGRDIHSGGITIANAGQIGSVGDTDAIAIASDGVVTLTQKLIGTELDISGNVDVDGTTNLDVVDIDGAVDMATTLALAGNADFNGNLDVAGLTLLTNALTVTGNVDFNGSLDVLGITNLDVVDIDGAVDMATTALVTGVLTTTATQVATGGITSGSSILSDTDSTDSLGSTAVRWLKGWFDTLTAGTLTIGAGSVTDSSGAISFGNENLTTTGTVTAAGTSVFTNLDISGDVDVDGTLNVDAIDIDGNVQVDGTVTVGVNDTGHDVKFYGATSGAYMHWDESTDDLILAGASKLGIGTASPGTILDINDDASTGTGLRVTGGGGGGALATFTRDVGSTGSIMINSDGGDPQIRFTSASDNWSIGLDSTVFNICDGVAVGANQRLVIDTSGNVGIGTTSPSKKLQISSDANAQSTAAIPGIRIENTDTTASDTNVSGEIEFFSKDASEADKISGFIKNVAEDAGTKYALTFGAKATGANAAEAMRIDNGGNVGIGTAAPQGHLHINTESAEATEVYIDGESNQQKSVELRHYDASEASGAGRNTFYLKTKAADKVTLGGYNDSSSEFELVTFQENGNVGIGTTSPAYKLEVNGDTVIGNDTDGNAKINSISGDSANGSGNVHYTFRGNEGTGLRRVAANTLALDTTSQERVRIDSSGNVGIGITSPNSKLTIVGDDAETAAINTATATTLEVAGNGGSSNSGGAVIFSAASGAWKFAAIKGLAVSGTANTTGDLAFSTRNATGDSTLTERMRIKYDGNIGIGTAAPAEKLEVAGNIQLDSSNANLLIKQGTGGTTGGMYFMFSSDATKYAGMEFVYDTRTTVGPRFYSQNGYDLTVDSGDDLHLQTDSTDRLTILNAGNVGIGTTSPLSKLNVTQSADGFEAGVSITKSGVSRGTIYLETSSNTLNISRGSTDSISIDSSGNVGIGTTSPDESLDVVGAGRFSTGVTFGTDTAAANKLDDYEEGTFTPVLKIGGATTGIGYGAAVGSYTKIGNLVNASLYVLLSSKGSATGSVTIDGLPFASANTTNGFASAHIGSILACTWANYPAGYLSKNTSAITFNQYTEAGGSSAISNSNLTDTSSFIMSITYRV